MRVLTGVSALVVAAGAALAQPIGSPVNVLVNPRFEDTDFGGNFLGWTSFFNAIPNIIPSASDVAIEGFQSVQIFGPFAGFPAAAGLFQTTLALSVEPGDRWSVAIDALHLTGDALAGGNVLSMSLVYIDTLTGQGNLVERNVTLIDETTPTDTVQRTSLDFVAPIGVDAAQLVIVFFQPAGGIGAGILDNAFLGLVEENAEIPFFNGGFEDPSPFQQAYNGWAEFGNSSTNLLRLGPADGVVPFEGDFAAFMFGQFNGVPDGNDSGIFQTLPAAAGENWEAEVMVRHDSDDAIGVGNFAILSLQFLDSAGEILVDINEIIADSSTATDVWLPASVAGVAPAGTDSARMTLVYSQAGPQADTSIPPDGIPDAGTEPAGAVMFDAANLAIAVAGPLGCNPADLSDTPPGSGTFGQLDGNDISAFVAGFIGGMAISDLSDTPPGSGTFGQLDGNDISAFVGSFIAGCP